MKPKINLQQVVRILARVSAVGLLIAGIVSRFDPPAAVWITWVVLLIALIDFGLYLHELSFPYKAGAWTLLGLSWFVGFLYFKQLADRLDCPAVEYRGKLVGSVLQSPENPCLRMGGLHFPPDTVFLFVGPDIIYLQKGGTGL